jgi:hypothetical protein
VSTNSLPRTQDHWGVSKYKPVIFGSVRPELVAGCGRGKGFVIAATNRGLGLSEGVICEWMECRLFGERTAYAEGLPPENSSLSRSSYS